MWRLILSLVIITTIQPSFLLVHIWCKSSHTGWLEREWRECRRGKVYPSPNSPPARCPSCSNQRPWWEPTLCSSSRWVSSGSGSSKEGGGGVGQRCVSEGRKGVPVGSCRPRPPYFPPLNASLSSSPSTPPAPTPPCLPHLSLHLWLEPLYVWVLYVWFLFFTAAFWTLTILPVMCFI